MLSRAQRGDIALRGQEEYLPSHRFLAVDYERTITGRGTSIIVFDPRAGKETPLYWNYENTQEDASSPVPPGYEVEVIDGLVKMTTSAAA
jgi:hypothetical protein